MLCLRCSHGLRATPIVSRVLSQSSSMLVKRTFTSITPLRPTLFPGAFKPTSSVIIASEAASLDLLPKISTHPALSTTQVRCGPRNTFSPSHFVRKRRHGFLSRIKTRKGRATLQRRKSKRRSTLSH
ncbi:4f01a07c-1842-4fe6-85ae-3fd20964f555 [Sclerotinia trifoliorum]|uniref:4f01a07c-1842-4fe6-85ae-3fd20964f555 n=1 Tax=Sclerotinia trifoliorum TaxID=28548 RepID=A0A8H2VPF6_9HELO|nr:4f01a07c-1842-4fe6-85ae-3fd20964f555 [Sclerotinia trifoliorum]